MMPFITVAFITVSISCAMEDYRCRHKSLRRISTNCVIQNDVIKVGQLHMLQGILSVELPKAQNSRKY